MSNVTFEEEIISPSHRPVKRVAGIPGWLVAHSGGIIRNETQASLVLMAFIVGSLFICYLLLSSQAGSDAVIEAPAGYEVVRPQNAPPKLVPAR